MARVELHHGQDYVIVDADDESLSDVAKHARELLPEVVGDERTGASGTTTLSFGPDYNYATYVPVQARHSRVNGGIAPKGDTDA